MRGGFGGVGLVDFAARIAWQDLPMAGRRTLAALSPRRLGWVVAAQFALGESSRQGRFEGPRYSVWLCQGY